jgi:hypothetical protein
MYGDIGDNFVKHGDRFFATPSGGGPDHVEVIRRPIIELALEQRVGPIASFNHLVQLVFVL